MGRNLSGNNDTDRKKSPWARAGAGDFHYLRSLKLIEDGRQVDWLEMLRAFLTVTKVPH